MTQYIDKDALVAEIEKRINEINLDSIEDWRYRLQREHDIEVMKNTLSLINTIEVKEVDIEKELDSMITPELKFHKALPSLFDVAKHFFELGLNASNPLTWEDMMLIHKCIKDAMNFKLYKMLEGIEGQKEVYEEVLKRFKAQKGE